MSNSSDCAAYLRSQPGYRRCMEELRKKWESYGRAGGRIRLTDATQEERRLLGGIVGKTFHETSVSFPFAEFERGLQKTRFAPVDMRELLEAYFGTPLSTNREKKQREQQSRQDFLEELAASLAERFGPTSPAARWMRRVAKEHSFGYGLLLREYGKDREVAQSLAGQVGTALERLYPGSGEEAGQGSEERGAGTGSPAEKSRPPELTELAVFAAEISGNPHFLDRGVPAGQLLVAALCCLENREAPQNARQWRELLHQVGIAPDSLSSFVHVYGLGLETDRGLHPAYEAFRRLGEPCVVTLENLRGIAGVEIAGEAAFVVENEMVFGYLLENAGRPARTLLCTSGQPRTAALEVLDRIVQSGKRLCYSGDMDPEGLEMADRLWKRYGSQLEIWRMSPAEYARGISEEPVAESRLARLENLGHPLLRETAACLRREQRAAYQENILAELLGDFGEI